MQLSRQVDGLKAKTSAAVAQLQDREASTLSVVVSTGDIDVACLTVTGNVFFGRQPLMSLFFSSSSSKLIVSKYVVTYNAKVLCFEMRGSEEKRSIPSNLRTALLLVKCCA